MLSKEKKDSEVEAKSTEDSSSENTTTDETAKLEAKAVEEVRTAAIDAAVKASETLLAGQATGSKGDDLINQSISELKDRMN